LREYHVIVFFYVGMEATFKPVSRLIELLGPKPTHPWGALIPQVLLWSFRRFCIQKLVTACDTPLTEQMWDDYLELISVYAPTGLNTIAMDWVIPENIQFVSSSLEEYNRFFVEFLDIVDMLLKVDDEVTQDSISTFLDSTMGEIIAGWLSGDCHVFLIFPMNEDYENEFTNEQCSRLVDTLITFQKSNTPAFHGTPPPLPEPPTYSDVAHPVFVPPPPLPELPVYLSDPHPDMIREPEPEPAPAAPEPEAPAPHTVKEALKRRRTYRAARAPHPESRGKTRRTHPSL
jgi:hypothetical protein